MNPPLSIGIVTYNSEWDIGPCLESLLEQVRLRPFEIIVVDNASVDGTAEKVRSFLRRAQEKGVDLNLLQNAGNVGFTRAANQAWKSSQGRFFLLLNPDTLVKKNAVEGLVQFLGNHPDAGAVAPQLRFPDGKIQPSCRRFPAYRYILFELFGLSRLFPRSAVFNGWKMGDFAHNELKEVDQPQGACLLLRHQALQELGGLDERFFLFFSDVDLCRRLKDRGWKIYFYPAVSVVHRKGTTVYRDRPRTIWLSHVDFIRYFLKWYRKPFHRLINLGGVPLLVVTGGVRVLAAWVHSRWRTVFATRRGPASSSAL